MPRVLTQRFRDGALEFLEVSSPHPTGNMLLVETHYSAISPGTERMLTDFSRSSLLGKARKQPERVLEAFYKARTEGVVATTSAIQRKLDDPTTLGYANVGRVLEIGGDVHDFRVGDFVASNAPHGEQVLVPATLAAKVPPGSDLAASSFATIGAIAIEGIRLAGPTLGERFVVTGLGLVGLLAVQLLRANGCEVLGIDPNSDRRSMAAALGATVSAPGQPALAIAATMTGGLGVDGVLICASTTSSDPVSEAARMCRTRGRLVLVGVTGLELNRREFYEKELSFQVSMSYGPGRYDPGYEQRGFDYPFGYVRWTARRNMEAYLELLRAGKVSIAGLISREAEFSEAESMYGALVGDPAFLAGLLVYDAADHTSSAPAAIRIDRRSVSTASTYRKSPSARLAIVGAGNFGNHVLTPAFMAAGADVQLVVSQNGISASQAARRHAIPHSSSDMRSVLDDDRIDAVVIATRHDSHADLVSACLAAGKHVYVEKPLAVSTGGLERIRKTLEENRSAEAGPLLMVGFNRRFAPVSMDIARRLTSIRQPLAMTLRMNAGSLPSTHWARDPEVGGGRIIGEAIHLFDLAEFFVEAPITGVAAFGMKDATYADTASIVLQFGDGSVATIHYLTNGSPRVPKEEVEIFVGGRVLRNVNYRMLKLSGFGGVMSTRRYRHDKGHVAAARAFLNAVRRGENPPISTPSLFRTHAAALQAADMLRSSSQPTLR